MSVSRIKQRKCTNFQSSKYCKNYKYERELLMNWEALGNVVFKLTLSSQYSSIRYKFSGIKWKKALEVKGKKIITKIKQNHKNISKNKKNLPCKKIQHIYK